ncbi:hypothetical protein ACF3NA_08345 [Alkanindiges sp. WGS2144]|uniref:hypothetical protein n=1 Tax=Alkanindiges sp. WGS2144 TaxID=3366808 RepID=UPI003750D4C4
MKLFVIVFLCLSSSIACAKKDDNNSEIKQALDTSMQLLKLDEPIYIEIEADKIDKLHHAIFLSTVIKLGAIKD